MIYQYRMKDQIDPVENITLMRQVSETDEPPHTHEFIELVYLFSGEGFHSINEQSFPVKKGDLLFINYKQVHAFQVSRPMNYLNFLMKPEFISKELMNHENLYEIFTLSLFQEFQGGFENSTPIVSFYGKEIMEMEQIFLQMLEEFNQKQAGYKAILKGYMQIVFSRIIRKLQADRKSAGYMNKITPEIFQYIDANCFEKLSLSEIAEKCFYNPSYFSRVFKQSCGRSLTVYIQEKRIAEALRLLSETGLSIGQVAQRVGYDDLKQFYKQFKKYTGNTPGVVRNPKKDQESVKIVY